MTVLLLAAYSAPQALEPAPDDISLLFPPNRALVAGERIELIGLDVGGRKEKVTVRIREMSIDLPINKRTRIFRGTIPLEKGVNLVGIDDSLFSFLSWPKMASEELCLTIRSVGGGEVTMECYEKAFPHGPFLNDCAACHPASQRTDYAKVERKATLCYQCHERFDRKADDSPVAFVHGPVGFGDCLTCHDPHVAKSKFGLKAKGNALCLACHDNKAQNAEGKPFRYKHAPVEEGKCTSCHNPHASPNSQQLVRPGNDICTVCHDEFHQFHRKVVEENALTKVPRWFPRAPDGTMRCFGCHDAHGSDEEHMFIKKGSEFCRLCHKV